MKNFLRLVLFLILIFAIITGPSGERKRTFYDGSYSCEEISPSPLPIPDKEPVAYTKIEVEYEGAPQVLHILELDLKNPELKVFPVLSNDQIFGFEFLSDIDKRYEAKATVNAGFNFAYGQPSGLVVQNGKVLSSTKGYGRVLLINKQKAWFSPPPFKVWLETEDRKIPVDSVNPYPYKEGILIFTREYGPTNRIDAEYTVCVVRNNIVESLQVVSGELEIPNDGFLIVDSRTENSPLLDFSCGQRVDILLQEQVEHGYQCSGSLVENGKNVAKDMDEWAEFKNCNS